MNEIAVFLLGYSAKAVVGIILGKLIGHVISDIENYPAVLHNLEKHPEKYSANCSICKYGPVVPVDTITS